MAKPPAVLIVDDDAGVLDVLGEELRWEKFDVTTSVSAVEAVRRLDEKHFAVIISDQRMPEMTGLEFLARARERQPLASRILVTGIVAPETLICAINDGEIYRFLGKPWTRAELLAAVGDAVRRHELLVANERLASQTEQLNRDLAKANAALSAKIEQLTAQKAELDATHEALTENFEHSLGLCYRIINTFYPLIGTRTKAVVDICRTMSSAGRFTAEEKHVLVTSAWLHDIGLIGLDRDLLHRYFHQPEACTEADWQLIAEHPLYGQMLAAFVDRLAAVGATIRAHHERYDGRGYPDRVAGEAIPWTARCLAVAVGFVETGLPPEEAGEFLVRNSGAAFDPEAVRLFFKTTASVELPRQVCEIMVRELEPGMCLAKGLFSPAGLLLVPENHALTAAQIAKIRNYNLINGVTQRLLVYS